MQRSFPRFGRLNGAGSPRMHESETYAPSSASPGSSGGLAPREAVIGQASTASNASPADSPHPVIFFDGVCGLCNRFVDFVLRQDPSGYFQFSPLQGEAAAQRLAPRGSSPPANAGLGACNH